jgi:hypothetical protein
MSNFIRFTAWLENRVNELAVEPAVGAPGVADDPRVKQAQAQKAALAAKKYGIDFAKMARDPKKKAVAQQQVMGDPDLGPEVAASIFKNV